jgi:hypothetical protein
VGPTSTSANNPLFSPHHPARWAPHVRNRVNLCLDRHLLELQKITPGVVDLRSENVKWYHFVNFVTKVVVLCYSLLFYQQGLTAHDWTPFFPSEQSKIPNLVFWLCIFYLKCILDAFINVIKVEKNSRRLVVWPV